MLTYIRRTGYIKRTPKRQLEPKEKIRFHWRSSADVVKMRPFEHTERQTQMVVLFFMPGKEEVWMIMHRSSYAIPSLAIWRCSHTPHEQVCACTQTHTHIDEITSLGTNEGDFCITFPRPHIQSLISPQNQSIYYGVHSRIANFGKYELVSFFFIKKWACKLHFSLSHTHVHVHSKRHVNPTLYTQHHSTHTLYYVKKKTFLFSKRDYARRI